MNRGAGWVGSSERALKPARKVLKKRRAPRERGRMGTSLSLPPHLALDGRAVHHFKLRHRLALVVRVRARARALAPPHLQLHVFDLNSHEQEVNLPHDAIAQVILSLGVLELDVEAVLDADFHLDRRVVLGGYRDVPD